MRRSSRSSRACSKSLWINGAPVHYRVEWRSVRYPRLEFKTGRLLVVLPENWENELPLLERKAEWISRKQEEIRRAVERVRGMAQEASGLLVLGDFFKIETPEGEAPSVDFENKRIRCKLDDPRQLRKLAAILKERLLREVELAAGEYCEKFGVEFNRIFIRNQKTKWASCSSRGNLSFNFKLIHLPRELLRYVVCHEVLHLKEKGHGEAFWNTMRLEFEDCERMEKSLLDYWFFVQEYSGFQVRPHSSSGA